MIFCAINDDSFHYFDGDNNPGNLSDQLEGDEKLRNAGFCQ